MAIDIKNKQILRAVAPVGRVENTRAVKEEVMSVKVPEAKKVLPSAAESVKAHSFLEGCFLMDLSTSSPGYVGMLRTMARTGESVDPVTSELHVSKFSDFFDGIANRLSSSETEESIAVSSGETSGLRKGRKVEVTFV
jgi:hypothetical protein